MELKRAAARATAPIGRLGIQGVMMGAPTLDIIPSVALGFGATRSGGMAPIDLKHEIEKDIERYSSILEKYKSGKLETGNLGGQEHLLDKSTDVARHLENIIRAPHLHRRRLYGDRLNASLGSRRRKANARKLREGKAT
jgi:hypothetical protein